MANDKKLVEAITSMEEDFAQWYTDVVKKAELIDYTSVKGCMVIKPAGYAIWENIQNELDRRFKETGVQNVYLPMFIPESLLQKEKDHPLVVFLSAYDDFQYAQNAIRYGVRFYILKPSDFEEIKETFREIKQELDQRYEVFEPLKGVHDEDGIIAQVTEYISQEYRDGTLTKLAGKLYLNPSYLSQLIKLKT